MYLPPYIFHFLCCPLFGKWQSGGDAIFNKCENENCRFADRLEILANFNTPEAFNLALEKLEKRNTRPAIYPT